MNKQLSFNLGAAVCLIAVSYFIYYLLVLDTDLPFSIASVLSNTKHWSSHWRVLVVGFLPIYIALMFFGAATLGIFLGSSVQGWMSRLVPFRLLNLTFCKKHSLSDVSKSPFQVNSSRFNKM